MRHSKPPTLYEKTCVYVTPNPAGLLHTYPLIGFFLSFSSGKRIPNLIIRQSGWWAPD